MIATTLFFHCLIPVALALWLALGRPASVVHLVFRMLWIAVYVLTLAVAGGGWTWIGMWGRYAVMWIAFAGTVIGFARAAFQRIPLVGFTTWRDKIDLIISAGLFMILSSGIREIASRRSYNEKPVELHLPLPSGSYAILHGGRGEAVNQHTGVRPQAYAIDLVALGPGMKRAIGFTPTDPSAYAIFDRPLTAPCSGDVVASANDRVDIEPLNVEQMDKERPEGNFVTIHCKDVEVTLAHMRKGSVVAQPGQQVQEGDIVGHVGNSGSTSEPHLHIHATRGAEPAPIIFTPGGFLTRNDVVAVPR